MIPVASIGNRIIVDNNVYNLELRDVRAIKYIKKFNITHTVNEEKKCTNIVVKFEPDQFDTFNHLLDNAKCDIEELTEALDKAHRYFIDYEISGKTQTTIETYIQTLGRYEKVWRGLCSKPDYNLCLYQTRTLPFFNVECKDWVKANIDAIKSDYPTTLTKDNKAQDNTDYEAELNISVKNNNYNEWDILPIDKYPKMDVLVRRIKIFYNIGLADHALKMFLRLLLSPRECHIIKEPELWQLFQPCMESKNIEEIVRYCCYYAMYILRQEETRMFSQVVNKYRVLYTLEQAANTPNFYSAHVERNPHILQLPDDTLLANTMPFYLKCERFINTKEEFTRRFNLATGGAFKGVDLRSLGAAVTGSILIPCVQRIPALEAGFADVDWNRERNGIKVPYPYMVDTPTTEEDYTFLNFLAYYYPDYSSLPDDEYKKQVLKCDGEATRDEFKYESDAISTESPDTIELANIGPKDNVRVDVDADVENRSIKPVVEYNQLADIDVSITTRDHELFKENVFKLYEQIRANCRHRGPIYIKEVKTLASIKYKVYGPGLPRPMDIFRIPYDPSKMVKKFHVHAVRMYYDNDVTLFRSCVACLLSGVGESYKFFSCNKNCADVLLKYAQRGFSIILNAKERNALSNYVSQDERWGALLKSLGISAKKIYCTVTANHPFFRPGIYGKGIRMGLRSFERDVNSQYKNNIVVSHSNDIFPFGQLKIKDNRKMYPPNPDLINACLSYVALEEDNSDSDFESI